MNWGSKLLSFAVDLQQPTAGWHVDVAHSILEVPADRLLVTARFLNQRLGKPAIKILGINIRAV